MARKESVDKRFTQDIHIRLTDAEAGRLQKEADRLGGVSLSKAGRILMFKKAGEFPQRTSGEPGSALAELKSAFKKGNTEISKLLSGYERSLSLKNRDGEPAVRTEQTIRIMESIVYNQMKMQDALNEVIRFFGGSEVHVVAKPATGTAVGDRMSSGKEEAGRHFVVETARKPAAKASGNLEEIPSEFKNMANITLLGTVSAEPEVYQNNTYEMFRIVLEVEEYSNGEKVSYKVDCTDFKSRYKKVFSSITPGRKLLIAGDHRYSVGTYNGKKSDSHATVIISNMTFV